MLSRRRAILPAGNGAGVATPVRGRRVSRVAGAVDSVLHTRAQMLARNADKQNVDKNLSTQLDELVADTRALGDVVEDLLLAASLEAAPGPREWEQVDLLELAEEIQAATAAHAQTLGISVLVDDAAARGALLTGVTFSATASADCVDRQRFKARKTRWTSRCSNRAGCDDGVDRGERYRSGARPPQRGGAVHPVRAPRRTYRWTTTLWNRARLGPEIVDHHHGHITVTGAPGRGATFTLIFPVAEGDSAG